MPARRFADIGAPDQDLLNHSLMRLYFCIAVLTELRILVAAPARALKMDAGLEIVRPDPGSRELDLGPEAQDRIGAPESDSSAGSSRQIGNARIFAGKNDCLL